MSTNRSVGRFAATQENGRFAATNKVGRSAVKPMKDRSNLCAFTFADGRQCALRAAQATETPIACSVAVGRTIYEAPQATPQQLSALREKTEGYYLVMQTLVQPPKLLSEWATT